MQPGRDIYLVGGALTTESLIDAGLVDELQLVIHPLIAGSGKPLFATTRVRRRAELFDMQRMPDSRLKLTYLFR